MIRSDVGWLSSRADPALPAQTADRDGLRLLVATRDYPRILFWAGALVLAFSVLTYFTESELVILTHLVDVGMAVTVFAGGVLLTWGHIPTTIKPWVFAGVGAIFALSLLLNVTLQETPVLLTYAIVVLCALGPSTLAWRPYLVVAPMVILAVALVTLSWDGRSWIDWTTVSILSAAVGLLLLGARLRGINALADANAFANSLATTDELTGLLNRHGFFEHLPRLTATADRADQPVFVVFVDVRGLKKANDEFGHEFGDRVLQQAAGAMTSAVRVGDLVARWGGDEMIVVGIGRLPDAEAFNARLQARITWPRAGGGQWQGELSVGYAEGMLTVESIDDIIGRADEDMYRRRRGPSRSI